MASPRKPCKKCKKQIPAIALDCVFCGAKQEAPPLEELLPAALTRAKEVAARVEAQQASGDTTNDFADSFSTEPTLVGLKVSDLAALGIGAPQPSQAHSSDLGGPTPVSARSVYGDPVDPRPAPKPDPATQKKPEAPPSTKSTQITPVVAAAPERPRPVAGAMPDEAVLRAAQMMGIGAGIVMMVLFFLPWGGATSWQLLENLGGIAFMRQFWYLVGGLTLMLSGALPLPPKFRSGALMLAAIPIAFFGFPVATMGGRFVTCAVIFLSVVAALPTNPMKLRRTLGAAAGVGVAILFFLAKGGELVHIVGWLAAMAGFLAGASLTPWTSARRSTAN